MESWSVGYEGDSDVERHAGVDETLTPGPSPVSGRGVARRAEVRALRLRFVSDYI
jgi:hypothetical protein